MDNAFAIDGLVSPDDYKVIYTDLDNTLILWPYWAVNNALISFLKKSKNLGKKIILVTRSGNPETSLVQFGLNENFFDKIHAVGSNPKSEYVTSDGIFIDDTKDERDEVALNAGIPVFDPATSVFRKARLSSGAILQNFARVSRRYFSQQTIPLPIMSDPDEVMDSLVKFCSSSFNKDLPYRIIPDEELKENGEKAFYTENGDELAVFWDEGSWKVRITDSSGRVVFSFTWEPSTKSFVTNYNGKSQVWDTKNSNKYLNEMFFMHFLTNGIFGENKELMKKWLRRNKSIIKAGADHVYNEVNQIRKTRYAFR